MFLGISQRIVSKLTKVKDQKFILYSGIVVAVFAIYFSWVSYLNFFVFEGQNLLENYYVNTFLLLKPLVVFEIISDIYRTGLWEIFQTPINGIPLALVWLAEIGIILYLYFKTIWNYTMPPYNEQVGKWYTKFVLDKEFQSLGNRDVFYTIEGSSISQKLKNIGPGRALRFGRVSIFYLEEAPRSYFLFENIQRDKRGKSEVNDIVFHYLEISKEEAKQIMKEGFAKKKFFLDY